MATLVWLQWRLMVNRLRQARSRDGVERFSRIADLLVKAILVVLGLPLALMLAAGGVAAGGLLAEGGKDATAIEILVSTVAWVPVVWVILRPFISMGETGSGATTLMRLLPLPRGVFRNLALLRSILDPVVLLFIAPIVLLPLGMVAGGAVAGGGLAGAAGVLFLATVAALGSAVSLSLQLLLRRRGRAELVSLAVILVVSFSGVAFQLFVGPRKPMDAAHSEAVSAAEAPAASVLARYTPPALYGASVSSAARGEFGGAAVAMGLLLVGAVLLAAGSQVVLDRILNSPVSGGPRRGADTSSTRMWRPPGLATSSVAVAAAEARAHVRTVRGKIALISPALAIAMMAMVIRHQSVLPDSFPKGKLLLAFLAVFASSGVAIFSLNQFAVLRGGHLLESLLPLSARDLLVGKLLATTAMAGLAITTGGVVLFVADVGVRLPMVIAAVIAGLAIHVAMTPVAAVLSALFPKSVELSSIGRGAQPHGVASLVNLVGTGVALTPAVVLGVGTYRLSHQAWLTPVAMLAYLALAAVAARMALPVAARALVSRSDNITLVATGH
jgi:hypothetical protein